MQQAMDDWCTVRGVRAEIGFMVVENPAAGVQNGA